jgi:hypothetical protein
MAIVYKVLGQQAPATGVYTTALITSAAVQRVVSTVVVTNRAATSDTFRIRVAVADVAAADLQYIAYDTVIAANSIITLTLGITLASADKLYAGSAGGNCTFNAFGSEM